MFERQNLDPPRILRAPGLRRDACFSFSALALRAGELEDGRTAAAAAAGRCSVSHVHVGTSDCRHSKCYAPPNLLPSSSSLPRPPWRPSTR